MGRVDGQKHKAVRIVKGRLGGDFRRCGVWSHTVFRVRSLLGSEKTTLSPVSILFHARLCATLQVIVPCVMVWLFLIKRSDLGFIIFLIVTRILFIVFLCVSLVFDAPPLCTIPPPKMGCFWEQRFLPNYFLYGLPLQHTYSPFSSHQPWTTCGSQVTSHL